MPQYFFHIIHSNRAPSRDDVGLMFATDGAAKREGMLCLGEMIKEGISSEFMPFRVSVQIVREDVGIIDLLTGHLSARAQP